MPDARISELPVATFPADSDLAPLVQANGAAGETRRASVAQLRAAVLADRGAHVRDYGAKGDGTADESTGPRGDGGHAVAFLVRATRVRDRRVRVRSFGSRASATRSAARLQTT